MAVDVGVELERLRTLIEVDIVERKARDERFGRSLKELTEAIHNQGRTLLAIVRWLVLGLLAIAVGPESLQLLMHLLGRG